MRREANAQPQAPAGASRLAAAAARTARTATSRARDQAVTAFRLRFPSITRPRGAGVHARYAADGGKGAYEMAHLLSSARRSDLEHSPSLAQSLVAENRDLFAALAAHPWVTEFATGTLPAAALVAWARQSSLFRAQQRRALLMLRALDPPARLDGILTELTDAAEREPQQLADSLTLLGATPAASAWPACLGYSSYMLDCARSGLAAGSVAIYAAERAYLDTWSAVLPLVSPGARWHSWVDNWTCDKFRSLVGRLGQCVDELAGPTPPPAMRAHAGRVFQTVAKLELEFWSMCYEQRGWVNDTNHSRHPSGLHPKPL